VREEGARGKRNERKKEINVKRRDEKLDRVAVNLNSAMMKSVGLCWWVSFAP
jgi:hypothetical protein